MSNAGSRILRSVRGARAYARGEAGEGFVAHVPEAVDVKAIRTKLHLSQDAFARRFGFVLWQRCAIGSSIGGSLSRRLACCCL